MNAPLARRTAHHLVFALFALVVSDLWRPSTTILPDALLRHFQLPWARHGRNEPALTNTLLSDIPWMFEAKREEARRQILAGEVPLWDARSELGQPLFAGQQCALLSPFTWPQLLLGVRAGFDLSIALELLVLLYGTRRLLLRLEAPDPWATIGALLMACTGMCTVWRGYPVTGALAWMPWLWLSTLALERGGRGVFLGAIAVRLLLLWSGHPETAFKLLATDALLALLLPRSLGAKRRTALRSAGAGLLALALSAPLTLPTLEYLRESHTLALRESSAAPQRPPLYALGTLIAPRLFGSPLVRERTEPDWAGPMNASEITCFVSLGVLLAAALPLRGGRPDRTALVFLALAALAASIAFQSPLAAEVWNRLPLLRISAPPRWMFVLQAALVIVAARALAAEARAGRNICAAGLALLALAQALPNTRSYHPPTPLEALPFETPELSLLSERTRAESGGRVLPLGPLEPGGHLLYGLPSLLAYDAIGVRRARAALDGAGLSGRTPALLERVPAELLAACDVRWLLLPGPLPCALPVAGSASRLTPHARIDVPSPRDGSAVFGLFLPADRGAEMWLEDGAGRRARLPLEPGCELSLAGRRLRVEDGGAPQRPAGAARALRARVVRIERASGDEEIALRAWAEEELYLAPTATPFPSYRRIDAGLPCPVYAVDHAIGSAFALDTSAPLPSDLAALAARVRERAIERLIPERESSAALAVRSRSEAERWVAFSRVVYPGWRARLDGQEVRFGQLCGLYPAILVPPGEHLVEWIYAPLSLRLGLAVAVAAAVLAIALFALGLPRRAATATRTCP